MDKEKTRFTLSISSDISERAEALKKTTFFNKPYAEMFRHLILLGMEKMEQDAGERESA